MIVTKNTGPLDRFEEWYREAVVAEPALPDAMTLATADLNGTPSARIVLLKHADEQGFIFYTNLESQKGNELMENPLASVVFHWKSLKRQVRISGRVEVVSDREADDYFSSRPRGAQLGAWASAQSRIMPSSRQLEKNLAQYTAKFGVKKVPRPPFWSGYRIVPNEYEFWQERPYRLHTRERYYLQDDVWTVSYLYP